MTKGRGRLGAAQKGVRCAGTAVALNPARSARRGAEQRPFWLAIGNPKTLGAVWWVRKVATWIRGVRCPRRLLPKSSASWTIFWRKTSFARFCTKRRRHKGPDCYNAVGTQSKRKRRDLGARSSFVSPPLHRGKNSWRIWGTVPSARYPGFWGVSRVGAHAISTTFFFSQLGRPKNDEGASRQRN